MGDTARKVQESQSTAAVQAVPTSQLQEEKTRGREIGRWRKVQTPYKPESRPRKTLIFHLPELKRAL